MALGDWAGRARANRQQPSAQGECDRCGFWYQLDQLSKQFQWQGAALVATGNLVCPKCLDTPFEQQKVLILPADPKPRVNPRQSPDVTFPYFAGQTPPTSPGNQGFTVLELAIAAPIAGSYPTDKPDVLAAIGNLTGIPAPGTLRDSSATLVRGQPIPLLAANPTRTWMLIYNPTQQVCEFALGSTQAAWNGALNLQIGAGEAFFWASAQNLQPIYQGAISAIGLFDDLPLWAWDTIAAGLGNDGGVLYVVFPPSNFPFYSSALAPGALYLVENVLPSNEVAVGVVPGAKVDPTAPAVYFAGLTEVVLLALGGANLPLTAPTTGSGQLWNNGGLVCIA